MKNLYLHKFYLIIAIFFNLQVLALKAQTITSGIKSGNFSAAAIQTADLAGTWNGSLNTDWNEAGNWLGGVPASSTDIIIPASLSNYPVIGAGNAICRSIADLAGGSISGPGILTVGGNITNYSGAVTISCPIILPSECILHIGGQLTMSGILSGASTAITKSGTGILVLSAANTYEGAIHIGEGTIQLGAAGGEIYSPLGTSGNGTSVSPGGALDLNGFTPGTAEPLTLNGVGISGEGALTNSSGTAVNYHGAIVMGSTVSIGTSGNITLEGGISGDQYLIKAGPAILSLGNSAASLGGLTINAGIVTSSSGTMTISGNYINNSTFDHNNGKVSFNGPASQNISGTTTFNNLTFSGNGLKTIAGVSVIGMLSMEGNATVTGAVPDFGTAASLRYKGNSAQTTGIEFPSEFNGTGGVIIDNPAGVTLSGGTLKTVQSESALNIVNGSFILPVNGQLTIEGNLTNSVGSSGLIFKSDVTGTASLIHQTDHVPATVQRYISGDPETYHILSSPVLNQEIGSNWLPSGTYGNGTGYDLYLWNESSGCWIYKLNTTAAAGWNTIHPAGDFMTGRGYLYSVQSNNPTKTFAGYLNHGDVSIPLTFGGTTPDLKGFNLAGNPYPSSIDWSADIGWTRDALATSGSGKDMWIWNPTAENYGVFNSADATGIGTHSVTRYIAPMQGFFVRAANSGNLMMGDGVRIHNSTTSWKSATLPPLTLGLIVQSEMNQTFDEIRLLFGCSENQTGAIKLFSPSASAPSLCLPAKEADYAVRYLTDTIGYPSVPVQFKPGKDGSYLFKFTFDACRFTTVKLEDRQTGEFFDLKANPTYRFRAFKTDQTNRFVLYFRQIPFQISSELPASIATDGHDILIDLTRITEQTKVLLYDGQGRKLHEQHLQGQSRYTLKYKPRTQFIIVQLISRKGSISRKLLFNNPYK